MFLCLLRQRFFSAHRVRKAGRDLRDFHHAMPGLILNCLASTFPHYTAFAQIAAIPAKQTLRNV